MNSDKSFRVEKDSMGEFNVPKDAYYGAQTMRAVDNFPISSLRFPRNFIKAIGLIKYAAAKVNFECSIILFVLFFESNLRFLTFFIFKKSPIITTLNLFEISFNIFIKILFFLVEWSLL